jgi:hypothetical protein
MAAVAVIGLLFGMFMSRAAMRVDWRDPRIDDAVVAAGLLLGDAGFLYYVILVVVMVRGLINAATRDRKVKRVYLYGPVLAFIALVALLQVIDALTRGP